MSAASSQYLKPRPEQLQHIQHIIVLMLENRSFDNLLGWLYDDGAPRGQDFDGLHSGLWNPLHSLDEDGTPVIEKVYVAKNAAPIRGTRYIKPDPNPPPDYRLPHPDPGEGYRNTNHQLFQYYDVPAAYPPEPTNMGFVDNYVNTIVNGEYRIFGESVGEPRDIMTCFTPVQVPVLSTLAREFAVCDQWYGSVPSQTLPNRAFIHAATSCGQVNNSPHPQCGATTIYNRIQDAVQKGRKQLSWRVYASTPRDATTDPHSLVTTGVDYSLTRLMMTRLHDAALTPHFQPIDRFYQDAAAGKLPSYAFLEPQFFGAGQNDQHPPTDIRAGERLIADVYNAVVASPQWNKTLLVITYDEHGGCYDHVAPPGHAAHPDGPHGEPGQDGFLFNRFGVRVPTVLVSPWIRAGTVARPAGYTPFDHTSVLATVCRRFKLKSLTARDAAAPDLSCVLTNKKPRTDKPRVKPLPADTVERSINALHRQVEEVLTRLTGTARPTDQHVFDYIRQAYAQQFPGGKSARK